MAWCTMAWCTIRSAAEARAEARAEAPSGGAEREEEAGSSGTAIVVGAPGRDGVDGR